MDTTHLPPGFKEFIQFMNSEGVEYLLVGGYAVGFHGAPRFTADMDIWVNRDPANAARPGQALQRFGFSVSEILSGEFLNADNVFRFGHPPLQIDVITTTSGVEFSDCYPRRETLIRDRIEISAISHADLTLNKRASGRPKVLADLDALK